MDWLLVGETDDGEIFKRDATRFCALVATANDLAADRPDIHGEGLAHRELGRPPNEPHGEADVAAPLARAGATLVRRIGSAWASSALRAYCAAPDGTLHWVCVRCGVGTLIQTHPALASACASCTVWACFCFHGGLRGMQQGNHLEHFALWFARAGTPRRSALCRGAFTAIPHSHDQGHSHSYLYDDLSFLDSRDFTLFFKVGFTEFQGRGVPDVA